MKSKMMILELCSLFLLCLNMYAQYRIAPPVRNNKCLLTGNLQYDLSTNITGDNNKDSSEIAHPAVSNSLYSPLEAGLFSAVIPGAGQFYTKSYLQSTAFLSAEAIMWVLYVHYKNQGDQRTNDFNNYADTHWSVVRYAQWIQTNYPQNVQGYSLFIPNTANLPTWQQVNWSQLNAVEASMAVGTGFTHQLVMYPDQQYYEEIGKYSQFSGGWDDGSNATTAEVGSTYGYYTPHSTVYVHMRGDANHSYNVATAYSCILLANHVFSALEAAWNASNINHKIQFEGHIESRQIYGNILEFVPTLHLEYEL